jgi:hypothetical protein
VTRQTAEGLTRVLDPRIEHFIIEKMWSKIKSTLRELRDQNLQELFNGIRVAFEKVTAKDAKNWFESCGYFQH